MNTVKLCSRISVKYNPPSRLCFAIFSLFPSAVEKPRSVKHGLFRGELVREFWERISSVFPIVVLFGSLLGDFAVNLITRNCFGVWGQFYAGHYKRIVVLCYYSGIWVQPFISLLLFSMFFQAGRIFPVRPLLTGSAFVVFVIFCLFVFCFCIRATLFQDEVE